MKFILLAVVALSLQHCKSPADPSAVSSQGSVLPYAEFRFPFPDELKFAETSVQGKNWETLGKNCSRYKSSMGRSLGYKFGVSRSLDAACEFLHHVIFANPVVTFVANSEDKLCELDQSNLRLMRNDDDVYRVYLDSRQICDYYVVLKTSNSATRTNLNGIETTYNHSFVGIGRLDSDYNSIKIGDFSGNLLSLGLPGKGFRIATTAIPLQRYDPSFVKVPVAKWTEEEVMGIFGRFE